MATILAAGCGGEDRVPPPADAVVLPRFTVRGRWPDPTALSYRIDPAGGPVAAERFRAEIERGLGVWAATGIAGFTPCAPGAAPDFVLRWGAREGPDAPFGRDTSVAMTGPVGRGCTVLFDAGSAWQEVGENGPSLYQTAVHEVGHVVGLGHSSDALSVLHPQRENGRSVLAASDLDGLHSLYGGGVDGPGDLVIERDGVRDVPALRGVAPPGRADWTIFDSDGDRDAEILVWGRSDAREDVLVIYHFAPGPLLARTVGPILGVANAEARVEAHGSAAGDRWLDVFAPDGTSIRWTFDDRGFPKQPRPLDLKAPPELRRPRSGDLDGDGREEAVRRLTDE